MKKLENRPSFGQNILRIRKARKLTQGDLSKLTGLSVRMIAYYELEAVKPPIDKIEIIAKALNVGINELLGTFESASNQDDFTNIDSRTLKKMKTILALPKHQRHIIYSMAESFLKQKQTDNEKK